VLNKFVILTIVLFSSTILIQGQIYPYWFINQGEINCCNYSVGLAKLGYYVDSAFINAKREAILNYIRYSETKISGGQAFWNTEAGKYFLSNRYREEIDTNKYFALKSEFKTIDSVICKDFVAVLISKDDCNDNIILKRINIDEIKPDWVINFPNDQNYYYDIGCSQYYFYELSSWLTAEKQARFGIAKQLGINIKSLQKVDELEGQEIQNDEYSVNIKNMEVVSRYKDNINKIFYVLLRAKIKQ